MKTLAIEGPAFLAGIAAAAFLVSARASEAANVVPLMRCSTCLQTGRCAASSMGKCITDSVDPPSCHEIECSAPALR